ncbi:hypothetical protein SAMN04490220_0913 [Rhodococcus jostii]|uniref:Uncharacterized protein n=1 Tax=Rhodococcus jostii TaxID=132919 RepID=A0A1H4JHV3_RHOJO|nr:hypothetical protein SAMN04490220_0913 [Rhodococcus jostii]
MISPTDQLITLQDIAVRRATSFLTLNSTSPRGGWWPPAASRRTSSHASTRKFTPEPTYAVLRGRLRRTVSSTNIGCSQLIDRNVQRRSDSSSHAGVLRPSLTTFKSSELRDIDSCGISELELRQPGQRPPVTWKSIVTWHRHHGLQIFDLEHSEHGAQRVDLGGSTTVFPSPERRLSHVRLAGEVGNGHTSSLTRSSQSRWHKAARHTPSQLRPPTIFPLISGHDASLLLTSAHTADLNGGYR